MTRPSIEQLRIFLAVYRLGSINKAALEIGLSQPTVTAQLRSLEKALGHQLFLRGPRGVRPTAAAEKLADGAGPLVAELEEFLRTAAVEYAG
ncbi:LysR family transcriptional regulator [Nocardia mexicana]|uniref:Regulatory helix-turn-helix LysR family protein n=1 Tax=Nocardia mexicana TaxID=279262 RepID=A0A370H442_9NOCA|nr:LysR family transcriptional regulator [Nocardia mexicana]RDI49992.1 regulatory helix-turn-helix LysR family protein [Nocardia mexicana]